MAFGISDHSMNDLNMHETTVNHMDSSLINNKRGSGNFILPTGGLKQRQSMSPDHESPITKGERI